MHLKPFLSHVQEAALDPERWADLLHRLSRDIGAVGAILISSAHKLPFPPVSADLVTLMDVYYNRGWNERDIRFRGLNQALRMGAVVDQEILTESDIDHEPFYQDLLRPHECKWFCGIPFRVHDANWFLSIQRTARQGPFQPDEVKRLKTLAGPLSEAAHLSHALSFSRILGMTDALDHISCPAFILDERGRLLQQNDMARTVLAGFLDFKGGSPQFSHSESQSTFESTLARLIVSEGRVFSADHNAFRVHDLAGDHLRLRVIRLGDWSKFSFAQAAFLVIVSDTFADQASKQHALTAYNLTRSEMRLVSKLSDGSSLQRAADELGIRYETARTHLRSIYTKTGVNRQGALIALVAARTRP